MSVVLGGGGAKGFVHVGVLEELVARGYEIAAVFGTSIGAIIGSLFAYYATIEYASDADRQRRAVAAIRDLIAGKNFTGLLDLNFLSLLRRGLIKGRRVRDWLEVLLLAPGGTKSITFGDLPFDLNITITDAETGDAIVANREKSCSTPVAAAVRASMSIQGVFLEETIDFETRRIVCWDGGLTGNCRFDLALAHRPDLPVIASSVTYRGEVQKLPNGFWSAWKRPARVASRSSDFWLRQIESLTASLLGDAAMRSVCLIQPDFGDVTTRMFWISRARREWLFDSGRREAARKLDEFESRRCSGTPN